MFSIRKFAFRSWSGVFIPAFLFLFPFLSSSATLYCYALRSYPDGSICDLNWGGGDTSISSEVSLFPFLSRYKYWVLNYSEVIYYPPTFSSQYDNPSPQFYVASYNSRNISIPDDKTNSIPVIVTNLFLMFPKSTERCAISSISVSFDDSGHPEINASMYPEATIVGNGVVTYDSVGNSVVSFPDSTGFIPGYFFSSEDLSYKKCWYDVSSVSNNRALRLENLPFSSVSALSYDNETGLYSFVSPDYTSDLAAIRDSLDAIRAKEYETDLHLTVDSLPVTVNPEITVNPPQVSVSVSPPEVTVNPEITVNPPDVNVEAPIVNVPAPVVNFSYPSNTLTAISQSLDSTQQLSSVDTSLPAFDSDEQSIIEVYQGWDTAIPGIGEVCNMGLDLILGPIPQLGQTLNAGYYDLLEDYSIDFDFSAYAEIIRWFRAICLFALILVFAYCLWNMIVQSFQI